MRERERVNYGWDRNRPAESSEVEWPAGVVLVQKYYCSIFLADKGNLKMGIGQ